jgi:hypothetical protein
VNGLWPQAVTTAGGFDPVAQWLGKLREIIIHEKRLAGRDNPAQQEHKGVLGQERKQKNDSNEEQKGILMKSTLNNGQDDGCLGIARWTVGVVLFFIFYFPFFGFWIFGVAPHHVISCLLGPSQITSRREDESPRIISLPCLRARERVIALSIRSREM